MKVAPEHSEEKVLRCMGKPGTGSLLAFRDLFRKLTAEAGKEQFLTYYLIAAHPGQYFWMHHRFKAVPAGMPAQTVARWRDLRIIA